MRLGKLIAAAVLALSAIPAEAVQYYGYPQNAVPLFAASGNTPNAEIELEFAATPGWVNYLTHATCTAAGATAASNQVLSIAGTLATAPSYIMSVPAGATVAAQTFDMYFEPPLMGVGGDAITLTLPALGTGNTHAACNMQGYRIRAN